MNLLPVIYASLLIFASLFLIVLVTSYITYKVKQYNSVALVTANANPVREKNYSTKQQTFKFKQETEGKIKSNDSRQVQNSHNSNRIIRKDIEHKISKEKEFNRNDKHVVVKNSHSSRMMRIQDLRSSSSIAQSKKREFNYNPVMDQKTFSSGSILRYYEDF